MIAPPKRRGQYTVKGATLTNLPVRQPTIFALAITLETAKILGEYSHSRSWSVEMR